MTTENLIGFLSTEDTLKLRELTGCDKINESIKSAQEIQSKIIDLWLGNDITHHHAKKSLEIVRAATQGVVDMRYEYNEDVVGYVVTMADGRSCNFQFDKIFSNHPQPKYELKAGCAGDDTHRQFTEDELIEMDKYLSSQDDVKETLKAFNIAIYENENFANRTAPIQRWEVLEAAESDA